LEGLRKEGYEAIYLGIGLTQANSITSDPKFNRTEVLAEKATNFSKSKNFLTQVMNAVKQDKATKILPPKLSGHVLVLGIGDTALDCARSAFRIGADRVTVMFRRGWQDLRANDEIFDPARMEGINFIPYSAPVEYGIGKDGQVTHVDYDANFPTNNDPNNLAYKKTN
jgi:NADPH-dependent glutamate synthase beta subunit-like oxidoreductase